MPVYASSQVVWGAIILQLPDILAELCLVAFLSVVEACFMGCIYLALKDKSDSPM